MAFSITSCKAAMLLALAVLSIYSIQPTAAAPVPPTSSPQRDLYLGLRALLLYAHGALEGTLTQLFQYSNPNADNVTKKVCSLLSYYEMVKSIDDSEALNGSLRTFLKQNLMDACAWVKTSTNILNTSLSQDNDSLADSGNSSLSNSSCSSEDVTNLRAFCIKRVIRDVTLPAQAYLANLEEVDRVGSCATRKWVERSIPEPLQSRITATYSNCRSS